MATMREISCPGCGLTGGPPEGPTHPYMLSSPRCWSMYGELLATGPSGQLAVDAYAIQHPGIPERRAIQSVGAHLVRLCAFFEHDSPAGSAVELLRRAVDQDPGWRWLEPTPPVGTITVADVMAADSQRGRAETVEQWAVDTWNAYRDHHDEVRQWLSTVLER